MACRWLTSLIDPEEESMEEKGELPPPWVMILSAD